MSSIIYFHDDIKTYSFKGVVRQNILYLSTSVPVDLILFCDMYIVHNGMKFNVGLEKNSRSTFKLENENDNENDFYRMCDQTQESFL